MADHPFDTFVRHSHSLDLRDDLQAFARSLLGVVKPQIIPIRNQFFRDHKKYGPSKYINFLNVPFISGYIMGVSDAHMRISKIPISEIEAMKFVCDTNNSLLINGYDIWLPLNYTMSTELYQFGVQIGAVDVIMYREEQAKGNNAHSFFLLYHSLIQFLNYEDTATLAMNLQILARSVTLHELSTGEAERLANLWNSHREHWGSPPLHVLIDSGSDA